MEPFAERAALYDGHRQPLTPIVDVPGHPINGCSVKEPAKAYLWQLVSIFLKASPCVIVRTPLIDFAPSLGGFIRALVLSASRAGFSEGCLDVFHGRSHLDGIFEDGLLDFELTEVVQMEFNGGEGIK